MTEPLTESFCERCGTRYTFGEPPKAPRLSKLKVLTRGLRGYVMSDETTLRDALGEASSETQRHAVNRQLESFQSTFSFCLNCREYLCPNCWNDEAGRCVTCAPIETSEAHATGPAPTDIAPAAVEPARPGVTPVAEPVADLRERFTWPDLPALPPNPPPTTPVTAPDDPWRDLSVRWSAEETARRAAEADLARDEGAATADEVDAIASVDSSAVPPAEPEPQLDLTFAPEPAPASVEPTAAVDPWRGVRWTDAETAAAIAAEADATSLAEARSLAEAVSEAEAGAQTTTEAEADMVAAEPESDARLAHDAIVTDPWRDVPWVAPEPEPASAAEPEIVAESVLAAEPALVAELEVVAEVEAESVLSAESFEDIEHEPPVAAQPPGEIQSLDDVAVDLPSPQHRLGLLGRLGLHRATPDLTPTAEEEPLEIRVRDQLFAADEAPNALEAPAEDRVPEAEPEPVLEWAPAVDLPTPPVEASPEPPVAPAPEPAHAPAPAPVPATDVWWIVAPDAPVAHDDIAQPTWNIQSSPDPLGGRPAPPAPSPVTPTRPTVASSWVGHQVAPAPTSSEAPAAAPNLWASSSREVVSRPGSGVQACHKCALPLSASARFCRRCGSPQG